MRDIHYTEHYLYGQLRRALTALNFQEHDGMNEFNAPIRAFHNKEFDALITLPNKPDTTPLEPIYLRAAEKTVEDWGVADSKTFFRILRKAAQNEAQVA
jgi:hypothetical protein